MNEDEKKYAKWLERRAHPDVRHSGITIPIETAVAEANAKLGENRSPDHAAKHPELRPCVACGQRLTKYLYCEKCENLLA